MNVEGAFVCIVRVGNNSSDSSYNKALTKNFELHKVKYAMYDIDESISIEDFQNMLSIFDRTNYINGVFLYRPLPPHLEGVTLKKDLDFPPCTPTAVMKLLSGHNIELKSKNVLIIGRSEVVGKPLVNLFLEENATVTVAHSYTLNLTSLTRKADIIVCAVGIPKFLTKDMVKENAVVVDVGINFENGKLVGDADFEAIKEVTKYISPVPGGVGPITNAIVLLNLECFNKKNEKNNRA